MHLFLVYAAQVGDFHRTLLYGGIYGYPGDAKNKNGKLRLLYECAPMSFIAEQAGGKGSTGKERVLDIKPSEVHQRVPLFIGEYPVCGLVHSTRATSLGQAMWPVGQGLHWTCERQRWGLFPCCCRCFCTC
jgi:hypothetical protein